MTADSSSNDTGAEAADETLLSTERGAGGLLEAAVTVASVVLLVGLMGFIAWQAVVTPTGSDPVATVESVTPMPADAGATGSMRVTVQLDNRGTTGLRSVEVVVRCGGNERSLQYAHVPANGRRTGTAVCPAGSTPSASVVTWVTA